MQILLTGATGFIGSHLAPLLLAQGHCVLSAGRHRPADERIGFIEADFVHDIHKDVWAARLTEVDVVINAVGIIRETAGQEFTALHTQAPKALFAACVEAGVKTVIQISALGADEQAMTPYQLSKRAADDYLASLPIVSRIVQPSLIYGADGASSRMFRTLATMPLTVRFGSAPQLVQPVHIDDVCEAIAALILAAKPARSERIALVGPRVLPFHEYLTALRRQMGLGRQLTLSLPTALARAAARIAGLLPGSPLTPDTFDMLARGNTADSGPIARLLGRAPRDVATFIGRARAERQLAQLGWLLPLLRISVAMVWLWTAWVSAFVYPAQQSFELLARTGVPLVLAPLMLFGASALDFAMGAGCLVLPQRHRRWLWLAQLALIGFYTVAIAFRLPEFLWHPYGPLSKNLPMLAAIWTLYELEKP
jgi:uncharacterized protein YbjT (DUF2867 family)